jgi:hypothetical protein
MLNTNISAADTDTDPQGHITAVLTIELHIFKLNCTTPLLYNPFLSHWVTTAAAIQQSLPEDLVPWHWKARLEIIRLALTSPGVEDGLVERGSKNMEKRSPESIVEKVGREKLQLIDLSPFVAMMEKQGLKIGSGIESYLAMEECRIVPGRKVETVATAAQSDFLKGLLEKTVEGAKKQQSHASIGSQQSLDSLYQSPAPHENVPSTPQDLTSTESTTLNKGKDPIPAIFPITSRSTLASVHQAIQTDPEETSRALMRLPLDLPSLELLTQVLEGEASSMIDADTITREYIQHSLRIIERIGSVFSPASENGFSTTGNGEDEHLPSGREEQIRAVKLLVMFMRNLLRKGKLPVQELSFDIEEICVRYLFIGEVKEFRKMLEGGDVVAAAATNEERKFGIGG